MNVNEALLNLSCFKIECVQFEPKTKRKKSQMCVQLGLLKRIRKGEGVRGERERERERYVCPFCRKACVIEIARKANKDLKI